MASERPKQVLQAAQEQKRNLPQAGQERQSNPRQLDEEMVELCRMMRVMSERDVDATLAQVLKTMMLHSPDRPVGGSELSEISGLNRITVIHHLKRLESAGFVRKQETKYVLRVRSAEDMITEFRKDMERVFNEMDELAREIDGQFESMGNVGIGFSVRRIRKRSD